MSSIRDEDLRRTALVFYEDDIEAIDHILDAFLKRSAARCSLLVDKDGHMITARGETADVDLDTISALVAGSFAATRALAGQFGEKEFTALFHQGSTGNIQLSLVGDRALLTTIFEDTTTIGMVRLYAKEAAKRLTDIFTRKRDDAEQPASHDDGDDGQGDEEFSSGSEDSLNNIFG